jgi:succinylglutamate desuccinylase
MIVLEILLGDASKTSEASLGAILSSRLAYSIAENRVERATLEKEFRELYDLRSGIVHRGHSRFSGSETAQLERLRKLCARLIRHEIHLLYKDTKSDD